MSVEASAKLFSALGDPIRLRILSRLVDQKQCVCDIQADVGIAANLLSYHLRVLREAGLVHSVRRGRWVDYELAPDAADRISAALPIGP